MRVILTQNVPKLGEVGDVVEVAPGYGRNFLMPQGLAILATSGALKQIDDLKRTETRRRDRIRGDMQVLADRIEALELEFTARVGETGRLFGSITAANIAERIEEEIGEDIDRRKILLDESLKTLGEHEVPIHLMPGLDAAVTVVVSPDEAFAEEIGVDLEEALDEDTLAETAMAEPDGEEDGVETEPSAEIEAEPPERELEQPEA